MSNTVTIERKGENCFETKQYTFEEALPLLNNDIKNEMTIWIDGSPFQNLIITSEDLLKCKKEISVTNKLVGG